MKRIPVLLAILLLGAALFAGCATTPEEEISLAGEVPKEEAVMAIPSEEELTGEEGLVDEAIREEAMEPEAGVAEREAAGIIDLDKELTMMAEREGMLKPIYFDFDRFFIREDAKPVLDAIARWLKKHDRVKVRIQGHCDERGTNEYNIALGQRRANSARDYLVTMGIAPSRLSTISYGEERPVDPGHNEEAWAKNRRAAFEIVSK